MRKQETITGEIVYIYTMNPEGVSTPWVFSAWLNNH